jgi:hypothetical protein
VRFVTLRNSFFTNALPGVEFMKTTGYRPPPLLPLAVIQMSVGSKSTITAGSNTAFSHDAVVEPVIQVKEVRKTIHDGVAELSPMAMEEMRKLVHDVSKNGFCLTKT